MRSIGLFIIALILSCLKVDAQQDAHVYMKYRGSVASARALPSTHNLDSNKFEIALNYNLWVANKSLSYGAIQQIQKDNQISNEDINSIINDLDENNRLGFGEDVLILGLGLRTDIKEHPVAWRFSIADRMNMNYLMPKQLVQLIWQGNKQFEGETLNLSQTSLTGLYFREFSIGVATEMKKWNDWSLRGGVHVNYYQGLSGVKNPEQDFYFTTAVDAEYIEMDYDFEYRYTGVNDFDFFDARGHGFGINFGASMSYKNILHFDLGVSDVGSIKFTQDIYKIGTLNTFRFSGLGVEELVNPTAFIDSLKTVFTPEIDSLGQNSFKMSIGTKLSLMASWRIGRDHKFHGPLTLSMYYLQGFSEKPGSTTNPQFTFAAHRTLYHHFVFGISTTIGGFNDLALGGIVGVEFKNFRFSFQSDDLTGFLLPNKATGAAGGFIFQVLF